MVLGVHRLEGQSLEAFKFNLPTKPSNSSLCKLVILKWIIQAPQAISAQPPSTFENTNKIPNPRIAPQAPRPNNFHEISGHILLALLVWAFALLACFLACLICLLYCLLPCLLPFAPTKRWFGRSSPSSFLHRVG